MLSAQHFEAVRTKPEPPSSLLSTVHPKRSRFLCGTCRGIGTKVALRRGYVRLTKCEWTICRPTPQTEGDDARYVFSESGRGESKRRANLAEDHNTLVQNDLPKSSVDKEQQFDDDLI